MQTFFISGRNYITPGPLAARAPKLEFSQNVIARME
jgi:hypothetical protein